MLYCIRYINSILPNFPDNPNSPNSKQRSAPVSSDSRTSTVLTSKLLICIQFLTAPVQGKRNCSKLHAPFFSLFDEAKPKKCREVEIYEKEEWRELQFLKLIGGFLFIQALLLC
ncbi:hypothetical protein AVEN_116051-1 [Araneus ventricosus]|uniref:Uncharacterized protein n=1 Tax=Araneus ventricosus TaxID=182803 RepID=A0A4Y2P948_ARAVE|nr:hypothetical protein AVEN_116051-1 [Araneus ventricosus]